MRTRFVSIAIAIVIALGSLVSVACNESGGGGGSPTEPPTPQPEVCGPFPDWSTSEYILPYPQGSSYRVNQANCSGFGHSGFWKHGYDFEMDIGTWVVASRSGEVVHAQDGGIDGQYERTNLITIRHGDGTVMVYSHLTNGGVLVTPGQLVNQGEIIGRSGNTGNTGGLPHLHQSLHPCSELPGLPNEGNCPSLPFNYRNTDPNPQGLEAGRFYPAF